MKIGGKKGSLVLALSVCALATLVPQRSLAVVTGSFATSYDELLPGGGIAFGGAGLAGREDGVANAFASIPIAGIPGGSTVEKAYLYWITSGGAQTTAIFESQVVNGVSLGVGGQTCWGVNNSAARADVTALVSGNGVYTVAGLPSNTSSANLDTDGVSLVVIYSAASDPGRRVIVRDGIVTADGAGDIVADSFTGLTVPVDTTGIFRILVGDGQAFPDGNLTFAGAVVGTDVFAGGDGSMWDTQGYAAGLNSGVTSAQWTHDAGGDCLAYAAVMLDYDQPVCGNDVVEDGEACDDGGTAAGDCCDANCDFEPVESACNNGDQCTGDSCNSEGSCIAGSGTGNCVDDGSPCTVVSCNVVCSNTPTVDPTCEGGTKSLLLVSDKADEADAIKWKLIGGPATVQADLGDPVAATVYTLCVFDSSGGVDELATELTFGPSASWTSKDPKGFKFKDALGALDGVGKALIKTGLAGKSKLFVRAKGINVPMVTPFSATELFDQAPRVVVQLHNSTTPKCWDSEFPGAKVNSASKFKAKTP